MVHSGGTEDKIHPKDCGTGLLVGSIDEVEEVEGLHL